MKKTKEQTIKRMQTLKAQGLSLRKMADIMNQEGYKTFQGLPIKTGWLHYHTYSPKAKKQRSTQMIEIVPAPTSSGKIVALVGNPEDVMKAIGFL